MRVKSAIWVAAYVRRRNSELAFTVVRRRGAEEAGAIAVKIDRLDGTADLYLPAPQTEFEDGRAYDRRFTRVLAAAPQADVEKKLARETAFDTDLWIVEVEDRGGRSGLDDMLA